MNSSSVFATLAILAGLGINEAAADAISRMLNWRKRYSRSLNCAIQKIGRLCVTAGAPGCCLYPVVLWAA